MKTNVQRVVLGILIVLIIAGGTTAWYLRPVWGTPGDPGDVAALFNAYLEEHEPEGEKAWPIYRSIIIEDFGIDYVENYGTDSFNELLGHQNGYAREPSRGSWNDSRHASSREAIRVFASVLEQMGVAADRPVLGKRYYTGGDAISEQADPETSTIPSNMTMILLPELQIQKTMARLAILAMRDAASRDDWGEYTEHLRSAIRLGEHVGRMGALVEFAVGASIIQMVLEEVRYTLVESSLSEGVVSDIREAIRFDLSDALIQGLELNRIQSNADILRIYDRNGFLIVWRWADFQDGEIEGTPRPPRGYSRWDNLQAYKYPRLEETRRDIDEYMDYEVARAEMLRESTFIDLILEMPPKEPDNEVLAKWGTVSIRSFQRFAELRRDVMATQIALTMAIGRARTGEWPLSFEPLGLPTDPYGGGPFAYAAENGEVALLTINPPFADESVSSFLDPRPGFEEDETVGE